MVAKVVKLLAVPAALGLASFRVYSVIEEKTDQISPQDLPIYVSEPAALRYVEEKAGRLQTGFGLIRARLRPYVGAVQDTCTSVKLGAVSLYRTGHDTYDFLRDPPPGFLPRLGIITVSGLAGVILAHRGSRFKRIGVPVVMTAFGAAVCFPVQTTGVLKVTSKKAYAAGSAVASVFRSTPEVGGDHKENKARPPTQPDDDGSMAKGGFAPKPPAEASPDSALENVILSEVASVVETTPPPSVPVAQEDVATRSPVEEKPRFVPDPSLVDHGQAHPDDADLYSTRG